MSPMRYGDDFARYKPRCDVLFDAHASAPDGQPVPALAVRARVATMCKQIKVQGPRIWKKGLASYSASSPSRFTTIPLHYGFAFGGTHTYVDRDGKAFTDTFVANPVGTGWSGPNTSDAARSLPLPCLEDFDDPVCSSTADHRPVALSPIPRQWPQRMVYAGTYEEGWRSGQFPLPPEDFDERFHQCAPQDQQIDHPKGGEEVELIHLLADRPALRFYLPDLQSSVRVLRTDYSVENLPAVVDTLFFETQANRFSAVWRASTPIRSRLQEFDTIAVGPVDPKWWQAKVQGIEGECAGCMQTREYQP